MFVLGDVTTTLEPQFDNITRVATIDAYAVKSYTNVQYSYLLVGVYGFISSFFSIFIFILAGPTLKALPFFKRSKDEHRKSKHKCSTKCFVFFSSVLFSIYNALELSFGGLITSFVVKGLDWDNRKGTYITTVYWGSVMIGRLLSVAVSFIVSPRTQLNFSLILINASLVCIAFTVFVDEYVIWICTGLFGFAMGPVFAAMLSWVSRYIYVTGPVSSCFFVGISIGSISLPPLTAYLVQTHGIMSLIFCCMSLSILFFVLFVLGQFITERTFSTDAENNDKIQNEKK